MTVINASAAVTLLEQGPEKIQAPSGIWTHDLCDAGAVLSQLSYQSHMGAVVFGLALNGELLKRMALFEISFFVLKVLTFLYYRN